MLVILLLLALFVPALCFRSSVKIPNDVQMQKAIAPLLLGALIAGAISLVVGVYTFLQMRKMQKKNQPKPNQLDGTIADEGISFYDLAGSPHVHTNITDIWDKDAQAIKKKSGGFLGMGKTSQVTGYRYYAKFAAFIGNRIEKLIAINFDNRKWVVHDPLKHPPNLLPVLEGNLFGEDEGGVSGNIDIHFGYPDQEPNTEYQKYFPLVSGYPYQSYLVFRGLNVGQTLSTSPHGFYLGNSGYMKEMLLWVKRTRVRNDGRGQWYEVRGDGAVVCEIGAREQPLEGVGGGYRIQSAMNLVFSTNPKPVQAFKNVYFNDGEYSEKYVDCYGALESHLQFTDSLSANISIQAEKPTRARLKISAVDKNIKIDIDEEIVFSDYRYEITLEGGRVIEGYTDYQLSFLFELEFLEPEPQQGEIFNPDINPIHKIREILTDDTAMSKPESDVNDVNFVKAADRIWDEGLGISWAIDEKSCIEAIEELCYHIEAGIRVNRQTGLYEMVLFRDDWFEEREIHTIAENKIKDLSLEVMNSDDIVNQLNVNYYDRKRIKNSAFSVYENGSILTMGHVNAETVDFPYFMNMRNAEIVANWKLKQFSTPAWSGSFSTGWREARKWNRYDLIRLPWSKKWNGTILVRIMKINLGNGTDNTVTIDFEEIVPYSGEMNTSIVADESLNQGALPPQPCHYEPFELPYYLLLKALGQRRVDDELAYESNFGLVGVVAEKPQSNSIYAIMMTHDGTEGEEWTRAATIDYSPTADLDQVISRTATSFTVKNRKNLTDLPSGTLIRCGSDWIGAPGEFMVLQSIDAYTGIITVKRGALDTLPQPWDSNVKLYFCGNEVDFDETGYVLGDEVLVSALTTTPSGVLEQKGSIPVEIQARAIRPYPPANVKINGSFWPEDIETDLIITWSDRNRLSQDVLDWFDSSIAIEPGTQTHLILTQLDENNLEVATTNANVTGSTSYTMPISTMQADTRFVKITLKTVRCGYECLQAFEHIVELSQFFSAPYDLAVEYKNDQ